MFTHWTCHNYSYSATFGHSELSNSINAIERYPVSLLGPLNRSVSENHNFDGEVDRWGVKTLASEACIVAGSVTVWHSVLSPADPAGYLTPYGVGESKAAREKTWASSLQRWSWEEHGLKYFIPMTFLTYGNVGDVSVLNISLMKSMHTVQPSTYMITKTGQRKLKYLDKNHQWSDQ